MFRLHQRNRMRHGFMNQEVIGAWLHQAWVLAKLVFDVRRESNQSNEHDGLEKQESCSFGLMV
jgi:hypothetical protein